MLVSVPCGLQENVYCALAGWNFYRYQLGHTG